MKKIIALSFFVATFLIANPMAHAVFSDVSSDHDYFEAIEYLEANAIVEGYEDGSFRPRTRSEPRGSPQDHLARIRHSGTGDSGTGDLP